MVTLRSRVWCLAAAINLAVVVTASPCPAQSETAADRQGVGVVFVVEGVGGFDLLGVTAQHALAKAGVPHEIRDFVWTHGWGRLFKDLQDIRYLLRKADELAAEIRGYQLTHPGRPVYVIGRSGGAALALAAVECLPPGAIERVILLSPAVTPAYDLRRALLATRREVVSYHSPHDKFVLGWGTEVFGTADRYYTASAGLNGFVVPPGLRQEERALYGRLVQISWQPAMIREGHLGTHLGTAMPAFLAKEVAPWLKSDAGAPAANSTR